MGTLLVKKLHPDAKTPVSANPGSDLGYDIFALEDTFLEPNKQVVVKTGISAAYVEDISHANFRMFGIEIKDRSGMAAKNGVHTLAGVIDAGYSGEIGVVMILLRADGPEVHPDDLAIKFVNGLGTVPEKPVRYGYLIKAGDKIAQMLPREVLTREPVREVEELPFGARGSDGFGSTGR